MMREGRWPLLKQAGASLIPIHQVFNGALSLLFLFWSAGDQNKTKRGLSVHVASRWQAHPHRFWVSSHTAPHQLFNEALLAGQLNG